MYGMKWATLMGDGGIQASGDYAGADSGMPGGSDTHVTFCKRSCNKIRGCTGIASILAGERCT